MDQTNSQSSTTILLVISILVLATIGVGWFALDGSSPEPAISIAESTPPAPAAPETAPEAAAETVETADEEAAPAITVSDVPTPSEDEIEADEEAPDKRAQQRFHARIRLAQSENGGSSRNPY